MRTPLHALAFALLVVLLAPMAQAQDNGRGNDREQRVERRDDRRNDAHQERRQNARSERRPSAQRRQDAQAHRERPAPRRAQRGERHAQQQRARQSERGAVLDALRRANPHAQEQHRAEQQRVRQRDRARQERGRREHTQRGEPQLTRRSGHSAVLGALRRDDRFDDRHDGRGWSLDRGRYHVRYDDHDRYFGGYGPHRGERGPAFCRSGAGHPVFGHRWCADRGYYDRRDVRYVYVDDRAWHYVDYGRDGYAYRRPRHDRPLTIVHYVVLDERDRHYDPYGYDPYGYDVYPLRDDDGLLVDVLQAILFPQSYYVEQPTYYVLRPRYYVAPPSLGFSPAGDLAVNPFAGSPSPLSGYPSSYHPPTYSLVSVDLSI